MEKWKWIGIGGAGILLGGFLTANVMWKSGHAPRHKGRTVRDWLTLLHPNANQFGKDDPVAEEAAEAIVQMGVRAIPELERILRRRPRSVPEQSRSLAARAGLTKPDRIPLEEEQLRAARAAWILAERAGADISLLIPSLSYHLTNSNYADPENARALVRAGRDGISVLTNLVIQGDLHARGQAAWALHFARAEPGVVDALLRAVDDLDRSVRVRALFSLQGCGSEVSGRIVPVGMKNLLSLDPVERWAGVKLLRGYFVCDGVSNALRAATRDLDERVSSAAVEALTANQVQE